MAANICVELVKAFLDMTTKVQVTEVKQINWASPKVKLLCFKEYIQESEQPTSKMEKKVFANRYVKQGTYVWNSHNSTINSV